MTPDEIRVGLEEANGLPLEALQAAVAQPATIAPAVIAVMQCMADGRLPLLREERLLRFGLHALAVAREASACPAFLGLLRRPPWELAWLFGEDDRADYTARLLLGLFDGDEAAIHAMIIDQAVESETRAALLLALARLSWDGRASREGLVDLLDRFDRENLAPLDDWAWHGWATAIMLLGLTDRIDRVFEVWQAGRSLPLFEREVDRQDWVERVRAAAEHPEDPQRFLDNALVPFDDPTQDVNWWATAPGGPDEPLSDDEEAWLEVALWGRVATGTMSLEEADGFLTALAVGPERLPPSDYLPAILGDDAVTPVFGTPEHDAVVAELLSRRLGTLEYAVSEDEEIEPQIRRETGDLDGILWARGYLHAIQRCEKAWQPLLASRALAERLIAPLIALLPDDEANDDERLTEELRWELIDRLPIVLSATRAFWQGQTHPLLEVNQRKATKIGRNDPCPCGSGKKYKRCCGVAA